MRQSPPRQSDRPSERIEREEISLKLTSEPSHNHRAPFWQYLVKALIIVILPISLATYILEHKGWLRSFETAALDNFFLLKEPSEARHVVIVGITEEDYDQLFHETSPLDSETLKDMIDAIARAKPKVIGVDLDTSARIFSTFEPRPDWPPVIWARDAKPVDMDQSLTELLNPFSRREERFVLSPVLGGNQETRNIESGVALLPFDSDSSIRRYQREFNPAQDADSKAVAPVDSFHWAVAKKYCGETKENDDCEEIGEVSAERNNKAEEDLFLNLAIDPSGFDEPIPASRVLVESTGERFSAEEPIKDKLKGKIVLLGGLYGAGRDEHQTPLGSKHGVELMAQAIESEFKGGKIRHASEPLLILLEILAGVLLVSLEYWFHQRWAPFVGTLAIPFIALTGSFIAFSSLALWANFIPILAAVWIHHLYDRAKEGRKLQKEVEEYRKVNKELVEKLEKRVGQDEIIQIAAAENPSKQQAQSSETTLPEDLTARKELIVEKSTDDSGEAVSQ